MLDVGWLDTNESGDADMAGRSEPEVPAAPFVTFLNERQGELERAGETNPAERLAEQMGWGTGDRGLRYLYRCRSGLRASSEDGVKGEYSTDTYPRSMIEEALDHAGVPFEQLYPEHAAASDVALEPDVHCPTCDESTTPVEGICPWCDTPVSVTPAPEAEVAEEEATAVSGERLDELAGAIREQAEQIAAASKVMIGHAIAIGEALLEAQSLVAPGEWVRWLETNVPFGRNRTTYKNYMRLAALKEHVDPDLTITANLKIVTGLQRKCAAVARKPAEVKADAIRLWRTGQFSYSEVGRMVGAAPKSVHAWVDPAYAQHVRDATRQNEANRRTRLRAVPSPEADRTHRYGDPGRAALGQAVRKLAKATTTPYLVEALLDIEAISAAWRERLQERRAA